MNKINKINKIKSILSACILLLIVSVDAHGQTLQEYAKQQTEIRERQMKEEDKCYEQARASKTIPAYNNYLTLYPKGRYVNNINIAIADLNLWTTADQANTVESYSSYIRLTKMNDFTTEAEKRIKEINAADEWELIKDITDIDPLLAFYTKYSSTKYHSIAQQRLHLLRAINHYRNDKLVYAYNEFEAMGGRSRLDSEYYQMYDEACEYYNFSNLSKNSTQYDLNKFITIYTESKYRDKVSNMLAMKKAEELTMYSSDVSFNEVLSYATDDYTKNYVKSHIKKQKESYSNMKKAIKRHQTQLDGGNVNFGLTVIDLGSNIVTPGAGRSIENSFYLNVGANVRFGTFRSPVQLEVGVKFGALFFPEIDRDLSIYEADFIIPIYSRLKINLFKMTPDSYCYISGKGQYNAFCSVHNYLNKYTVGGGIGFAWRQIDWGIYYDYGINSLTYNYHNNNIGSSISYYF